MEDFFAKRIKRPANEQNQLNFAIKNESNLSTNNEISNFFAPLIDKENSIPSTNDEETTFSEPTLKTLSQVSQNSHSSLELSIPNCPKFSFCNQFREKLEFLMQNENIYPLKQGLEDYFISHMKPPDLKNDFENEFNQIVSLLLKESQTEDIIVERERELVTEFNIFYNDILIRNKENSLFFILELKQVRFSSWKAKRSSTAS